MPAVCPRKRGAQNGPLQERLLAGQERFHQQAESAYTGLAASVDRSLKDSLEGSADDIVSAAWREELLRRREAWRSGAAKATPWAEARARLGAL